VVYSGNGVNIARAFWCLWMYSSFKYRKPPLLRGASDSPEVNAIRSQYRFGPLFYVAAVGISLLSAAAGMALCGVLALFFALPPRKA